MILSQSHCGEFWEVEGLGRQRQANDGDSCDCLDLSPSALVHRQRCGLTSNRLQLQMFPAIRLVCLCVYVCNCTLAMDVRPYA